MIIDKVSATGAISRLLVGATLDSFRVYSTILQLAFYRDAADGNMPNEVWISCSGSVSIRNDFSESNVDSRGESDFFESRMHVLSKVYNQIGSVVDGVFLDELGVLKLGVGGIEIEFKPDKDCFEEVWAVMSDSPNTSERHDWYIALDDTGQLGGRIPATSNP